MSATHFWKYQGTGNDFVMIDNRAGFPHASDSEIKKLCDRRFGIGADGLIYLEKSDVADFRMVYFNSDGLESTFCGNGGRCIAAFAKLLDVFEGNSTRFIAKDGLHEAEIKGENIRLKMRDVSEIQENELGHELFTGSPHLIVQVQNVDTVEVKTKGANIRYSERYQNEGINVNFIEQTGDEVWVRTYERGVEDETLSCGTGVTAAALVMGRLGMASPVAVETQGGKLMVEFSKQANGGFTEVFLIGPAEKVFEGEITYLV